MKAAGQLAALRLEGNAYDLHFASSEDGEYAYTLVWFDAYGNRYEVDGVRDE